MADEPVTPEQCSALSQCCARVAIHPIQGASRWLRAAISLGSGRSATEGLFHSPQLMTTVETWSRQTRYDAALAYCSSATPYLKASGLTGVPAIVDLVDVDSQKWFDYAAGASGIKRALFRLEGRRVQWLERDACKRASAVTLVSEPEAELCRRICPQASVYAVPNGVDLDYFGEAIVERQSPSAAAECVFVGALDYRANVEGVTWFCRTVWPRLQQRRPEMRLTLVGRKPVAAIRQLAALPGVAIAADVPDVRPYLSRAAVAIVPLRVARGIQNKVLEALAAQKPVIASSQALEGLDLEPGVHAFRADAPEEWIESLELLCDDSSLRQCLSSAGRAFVQEHHCWNARLEPLERLLDLPRCTSLALKS